MAFLEADQNSFKPTQRAILNPNILAHVQIGARFSAQARQGHFLDGFDLPILNRSGNGASSDNRNHTRSDQNWEALIRIKSTEHISGEQRCYNRLRVATPLFHCLERGKNYLVSLAEE
jgi:hypothetical protein